MIKNHEIYHPLYTDRDHFVILITGGRGSGKSFGVATFIERLTFELKRRGITGKEADKIVHNILYCRYTMVSASISVIPEFMEKIEADGTQRYFHATRTDVVNRMTGSRIMFRGLRTSSGNQTAKLKSIHGITTFVCDEAEEWTSEREFETIAFSIRQPGIQNRIIIMMNPTDSNHFIYRRYIKDTHELREFDGVPVQVSTHPDVLHIHTTYLDNAEHLSEEFIRSAKAMKESDPDRYAHIFMGRWADVAEGAVFKKWGVVKEFPENASKVAAGLDFGFTHDPSACIRCGIVGNDLYLDEAFYEKGMGIAALTKRLKELGLFVYADSADPRLIQEIANAGVVIYPVAKPPGSVVAGIERMKDFDNIFVTSRSVNLMEELRNYVWAKDKDGQWLNEPEDAWNHCFTADTLIITPRGEIPINEVVTGDLALTSEGYRSIEKVFNNGYKKILHIRLIFSNFIIEIKGTPDHRIKTIKGWKTLKNLKATDSLYVCRHSTAKNTTSTKENGISPADDIGCTEMFGNISTVKFPRGGMYITETATPTTTPYQTSNSSPGQTTFLSTQRNTKTRMAKLTSSPEWITLASSQTNGIGPKKEGNGTANMGGKWLPICKRSNPNANTVATDSSTSLLDKRNSARTIARPGQDTIQELTMNPESAVIAARSSWSTNIQEPNSVQGDAPCVTIQIENLKGIEILREDSAEVFDLQVADMHEYFANGILVHNCVDAVRYFVNGKILGKVLHPRRVDKSQLGIF